MKKKFTFLIAALALLTMITQPLNAVGQTRTDAIVYTLDGSILGTENSYGDHHQITQNNMDWQVQGNVTMNPWRIGGKSLSGVDRDLYSEDSFSDDITKVVVTNGTATLTVNSMTLIVSANADFSDPTSTVTGSWAASSKTTFEKPAAADWSGKYFKLVYNVTTSGSSNQYAQFVKAEFFKDGSSLQNNDLALNPTSLDLDIHNNPNTGTITYTTSSTGTISVSESEYITTTVNANNTITVTPVAVTPSEQTITVSQVPDANYDGGSATFTVTVANSTPTVNVTYHANGGVGNDIVVTPYQGSDYTVAANTFTYANYAFTKWHTNAEGTGGTDYNPGDVINSIAANVDLYAQWQKSSALVDVLNREFTGVTGTSYTNWNKSGSASEAVYAGNSAGGTNNSGPCIQIRTTNSNSGIVSTTSGGKVKKVAVVWNDETADNSDLDIYGKNTAYSAASDLYSNSTQGTKIGSITKGTSTELTITGDYKYIGIRSKSGARYLDEIDITWEPNLIKIPTFSPDGGVFVSAQNVTISCETAGTTIYYTTDGSTPDANSTLYESPISLSTTTTLKAIAIKGDDSSEVATAAYTFLTPKETIEEIYAVATSTSTPIAITFNNWVVSGNNGGTAPTQAYLSDNTEYGCVIYNSSGHGFVAGNVLNGTVVCNVKTYTSYGYTYVQLENLTTGTSGLTVTTGGTATSTVTTISGLSAQNVGAVFTLKDITYKGSNYFQDNATNNINLSTTLYTPSPSLTSGKIYDITGVFTVSYETNSTNKRTNPRFAADIVLKANMSITDFSGLTEFTYVVNNGPSEKQEIDVYGTDFASNLTVTASSDYEVSLDNTTYSTSVVLEPDASKAAGDITQTVYVRLKESLNTGDHNGSLTFSADNLTTKVVNLVGSVSASTTYTITLNQTTGGTISANTLVAEEDEVITLSVDFDDNCTEVTAWTVLDGLANPITVTNNQFTMPASNVEVGATFGTKSFTISYSVNGNIESILEEDVDCGDEATLYTASDLDGFVTLPSGFTLAGWSTGVGSTGTVTSYTPTDDATLYAVLIQEGATTSYVRIKALSDITPGTYFIVNDGYVLPSATTNSSPEKTNDYKIETPLTDSYNSLPVANTEWIFTGTYTAMTIKNSEGNYLYVSGNSPTGLKVGATEDTWAFEVHPRPGTDIFAMKDANNNRYCASYSSGSDWRSYTSANYGNYGDYGILYLYKKEIPEAYTRVEEISTEVELPSIEPTYSITVKNGGVLTLTGNNNGDASNLIIEDGGKLITYSTGVQATVEKDITGAGDDNWTAASGAAGWYFIASPVDDADFSTAATGDYDLYMLDWDNKLWLNQEKPENSSLFVNGFQRGTGYLYASRTGKTISVAGEIQPLSSSEHNATVTLATDGWNLIGNPLTCKATVSCGFDELNNAASVTSKTSGNAINPFQGIAVFGEAGDVVTFTKAESQTAAAPGSSALQMTVAQNVVTRGNTASTIVDNAVISFNEGSVLPKFTMFESNTRLYIPQDGKEYAIVSSEAQGEMPVNFKAAVDGSYTISVATEGIEANYLHLIDNLTGMDIDLLQTPSYTFNARKNDYASRFRLVFSANSANENNSDSFAFISNGQIILTNVDNNATVQVIDALGRMIVNTNANNHVYTDNMAPGVYVLRLVNGNDVKTQKIVVK